MRLRSVWTPSPLIVTGLATALPSTSTSISSTPEPAPSAPVTVVVYAVLRHPVGAAGVVLIGSVTSTLTGSLCQADSLPATSTARV